ncbi:MAG: Methyltransferase, UbiE/COQ5 family [Parcubacteria group bacterium GW2011_GWA1_45_7]|nr:MAG: Methyltransferase, UbiE/COQ5 family [Parcubacteria group bacterium GW2011_GWF1_45_5]KKU11259.1 MAG: Methyltransferase, UbiE/COQ5 family [Parcubacteria group bacterium GW2011_GWA1_45_7]KKU47514.1 MAG: Methyltransferase, UbiE/COQ5 family [Parcubacteria group bacterium GW2011_GWF2_46_8]
MEQILFDAEKLVGKLEIQPGQTVADFGAGSGFITLSCAKRVGAGGTVYALDVLSESLEVIATKAREQQLFNVKPIRANLEKPNGSTLPDDSCDWVIVSNILFQSDQQEIIIQEATRIAKSKGNIVIIDWYPEKMIIASGHYPVASAQVKAMAEKCGVHAKTEFECDPYHYAIVFEK